MCTCFESKLVASLQWITIAVVDSEFNSVKKKKKVLDKNAKKMNPLCFEDKLIYYLR